MFSSSKSTGGVFNIAICCPCTQQNITFCLLSWGTRCDWVIQALASTLETWIQNKLLLFHLNFISSLHLSLLSWHSLPLSLRSPSLSPTLTSRMTKPCKSSLTPRSVIWSRFSVVIFPPSQNDPYFKWHSSLLGKWNLCSCQPLWMSLRVY